MDKVQFLNNYENFYRGFTPDENSKRNYPKYKQIIGVLEQFKEEEDALREMKHEMRKKYAKKTINPFNLTHSYDKPS
jgi:hypothetical protein